MFSSCGSDMSHNQTTKLVAAMNSFEPLSNIDEDNSVFTRDELDNSGDWNVVVNNRNQKSQRISTGSQHSSLFINKDEFKQLSMDDKLIAMFDEMGKMANKVDQCLHLHNRVNDLETHIDDHSARLTLLEYKSIDMEARSRRNNLIFGGIQEDKDENCHVTISNFLRDHLDITTSPSMARAHRLGRFKRDSTRPIIVNFLDTRHTEAIISVANKLKNTKFNINRDFPKEIADARRVLWPIYKDLRGKNPDSKVNIVYPAKIVMDNKVYCDMFPRWNLIIHGNRIPVDKPVFTNNRGISSHIFMDMHWA